MTTMSMRRITAFLLVMIMMITSLPLSLAEETVNGLLPAEQTAEIRLSEEPETEEAPEEIPEASYSVLEGEEALIAMEQDAAQAAALGAPLRMPNPAGASALPEELDGSRIEQISISWVDGSDSGNDPYPEDGDYLYKNPAGYSDAPQSMRFQVNIALSGQYDYQPGDIEIEIPAQLWKDREGAYTGKMALPIPEDPETRADYNYRRITREGRDYLILTNTRTLSAATKAVFQFVIYDVVPHTIPDMVVQEPISAAVTVNTHLGNVIARNTDNAITAQMDTGAAIRGASKSGVLYEEVPDTLPAQLRPETPGDYVYVRWYTYTDFIANQPFTLSMKDYDWIGENRPEKEKGAYNGDTWLTDGRLLGVVDGASGTVHLPDAGGTVTIDPVYDGYRPYGGSYANLQYVWTCYERDKFPNGTVWEQVKYDLYNTVSWSLTEKDGPWTAVPGHEDAQETTNASARGVVTYSPMEWAYPIGHFMVHKWTEYEGNKDYLYGYALNKLRDSRPVDMRYVVKSEGFGYPWTYVYETVIEQGNGGSWGIAGDDLQLRVEANYGQRPYRMVTDDHRTYFNFEAEDLTSADFEMLGMELSRPEVYEYRRSKGGGEMGYYSAGHDVGVLGYTTIPAGHYGYFAKGDPEAVPDVDIYIRVGDGAQDTNIAPDAWEHYATASWKSGQLVLTPDAAAAHAGSCALEGNYLYFPENTIDYRTELTTKEGGIIYYTYPHIRMKSTPRVREIVEELFENSHAPTTKFKNDDTMTAYQAAGVDVKPEIPIVTIDNSSRATFNAASYGVSAVKNGVCNFDTDNDTVNRRVTIHYSATVYEQSNLSSREEYDEAVADGVIPAQTGGVWYDLLPKGVTPVLSTVKLRDSDSMESVFAIQNYKGSGRTLLVVRAGLTPVPYQRSGNWCDSPSLTFDALYTWNDITELGPDLRNYVAFESNSYKEINGEKVYGTIQREQGESDLNPAGGRNRTTPGFEAEVLPYLTNLDPASTEADFRTVYAAADTHINQPTYSVAELSKLVSSDLEGIWTTGLHDGSVPVNVYEGQGYTYRLRLEASQDASVTDIILYDALEMFEPAHPYLYNNPPAIQTEDRAQIESQVNYGGTWKTYGQWRGTLTGIDVSDLTARGVKADVYYTTNTDDTHTLGQALNGGRLFMFPDTEYAQGSQEREDFFNNSWQYNLEQGPNKWQRLTDLNNPPAGITGLAFDLRKNADGTDFVLPEKDAISVTLHMKAPSGYAANSAYVHIDPAGDAADDNIDWQAARNPDNNMHAFNNTRAKYRLRSEDGSVTALHTMTRKDYTKVGIMPMELSIQKVWADNSNHDGKRPGAVTVELLRTVYNVNGTAANPNQPGAFIEVNQPVLDMNGVPMTATLSEENGWFHIFQHLTAEDERGNPITYSARELDNAGGVSLSELGYTPVTERVTGTTYNMINRRENEKAQLSGEKVWDDANNAEGKRPQYITVRLYADGRFVRSQRVTPDANGRWTYNFTGLDKYRDWNNPENRNPDGTLQEIEYTVSEVYSPGYVVVGADETGRLPFTDSLTNLHHPLGDLQVTKAVRNTTPVSEGKQFTYTLQLIAAEPGENGEEMPLMDNYAYVITDEAGNTYNAQGQAAQAQTDDQGRAFVGRLGHAAQFKLQDGWTFRMYDLPSESTYTVTEEDEPGYTQSGTGTSGSIRAGEYNVAKADFVNTYNAEGDIQLEARKQLKGHDMYRAQFRFRLLDDQGNVLRMASNQAPAAGADTAPVIFGKLRYTLADMQGQSEQRFTYTIVEENRGRPGYTYDDSTSYQVTVVVTDDGKGRLVTRTEGPQGDAALFVNQYEARGTVPLKAWKALEGGKLREEQFAFDLYYGGVYNSQEEAMAAGGLGALLQDNKLNDRYGEVFFDSLTFIQNGEEPVTRDGLAFSGPVVGKTFVFFAQEDATYTPDDTVIYTDKIHAYLVTVYDNNDGTLTYAIGNHQAEAEFEWEDCPDCSSTGIGSVAIYHMDGDTWGTLETNLEKQNGQVTDVDRRCVCPTCKGSRWVDGSECSACGGTGLNVDALISENFCGDIPVVSHKVGNMPLVGSWFDVICSVPYIVTDDGDEGRHYFWLSDAPELCGTCGGQGKVEVVSGYTISGEDAIPLFTNQLKPGGFSLTKVIDPASEGHDPLTPFTFRVKLIGEHIEWDKIEEGMSGDGPEITPTPTPTAVPTATPSPTPTPTPTATPYQNRYWRPLSQNSTPVEIGNVGYYVNTDGELHIYALNGATDVTIPSDFYRRGNTNAWSGYNSRLKNNFKKIVLDDKENVTYRFGSSVRELFDGCQALEDIGDLQYVETTGLRDVSYAFASCSSLRDISALASWESSQINNIGEFLSGSGIEDLDAIADWRIAGYGQCSLHATNPFLYVPFSGCKNLKNINGLANWDVSDLCLEYAFAFCESLEDISGAANWDISNQTYLGYIFQDCHSLKDISPLASWDMNGVKAISGLFYNCNKLEDVSAIGSWDLSNVEEMRGIFEKCSSLKNVDLSGWGDTLTDKLTSVSEMFSECNSLESLSLAGWNVENLTGISNFITSQENLKTLNIDGWNPKTLKQMMEEDPPEWVYQWSSPEAWYEGLTNPFKQLKGLERITLSDEAKGWLTSAVNGTDWEAISHANYDGTNWKHLPGWTVKWRNVDTGETRDSLLDDPSQEVGGTWVIDRTYLTINIDPGNGTGIPVTAKMWLGDGSFTFDDQYEFEFERHLEGLQAPDGTIIALGATKSRDELLELVKKAEGLEQSPDGSESVTLNLTGYYAPPTDYYITFENSEGSIGGYPGTSRLPEDSYNLPGAGHFYKHGYKQSGWHYQSVENPGKSGGLDLSGVLTGGVFEAGEHVIITPVWEQRGMQRISDTDEFEITLYGGETATFDNLPAGTAYQIWEETPAGWVLVDMVNAGGIIPPADTIASEFINSYQPTVASTRLMAAKYMDGRPAQQPFTFALWQTDASGNRQTLIADNVQNDAGGMVTFPLLRYEETGTFHYIMEELPGGDDTIAYDPQAEAATVTVTEKNGLLVARVTYDGQDADPGAARFENRTQPGRLTLEKIGRHMTEKAKDTEFTFRIRFRNQYGEMLSQADIDALKNAQISYTEPEQLFGLFNAPGFAGPMRAPETTPYKVPEELLSTSKAYGLMQDDAEGDCEMIFFRAWNDAAPVERDGKWYLTDIQGNEHEVTSYRLIQMAEDRYSSSLPNAREFKSDWSDWGNGSGRSLRAHFYNDLAKVKTVQILEDQGMKIFPNGLCSGMSALENVDLRYLDISRAEELDGMFRNCSSLKTLDLSFLDMSKITSVEGMFYNCSALVPNESFENWDVSHVQDFKEAFYGAFAEGTKLNLKNWNMASATSIQDMFYGNGLTDLDISGWDLRGVNYRNSFLGKKDANPAYKRLNLSGVKFSEYNYSYTGLGTMTALTVITDDETDIPGSNKLKIIRPESMEDENGNTLYFYQKGWYQQDGEGAEGAIVHSDKANYGYNNNAITGEDSGVRSAWLVEQTVTYDPNGGFVETPMTFVVKQTDEGTFALPKADEVYRKGFALVGWKHPDGTVYAPASSYTFDWAAEAARANNDFKTNFVAVWERDLVNNPMQTYHHFQTIDGETYRVEERLHPDARLGQPYTFNAVSREGFVLDPAKTLPSAGDAVTVNALTGEEDIHFYYNRIRYTITLDPNAAQGGEGTPQQISMLGALGKNLPPCPFTNGEGKSFTGWQVVDAGGSPVAGQPIYPDGASVVNLYDAASVNAQGIAQGYTLLAQWDALEDGEMDDADVSFIVKLKPGQTATLIDLPAGIYWEIEEGTVDENGVFQPGVLPDGWIYVTGENETGRIEPNGDHQASVTNRYDAKGMITLQAVKTMQEGGTPEDGAYTFRLYDDEAKAAGREEGFLSEAVNLLDNSPTVPADDNPESTATRPNPSYGKSVARFDTLTYTLDDLYNRDTDTIEKEKTFTYYLAEVPGDDETVIYDGRVLPVQVKVEDQGDGTLKATAQIAENGNVFVNARSTVELQISKQLLGATAEGMSREFTVHITLTDGSGRPVSGAYPMTRAYHGASTEDTLALTNGRGVLTIRGDETLLISGLPHGAAYTVEEEPLPGYTAAYTGRYGTLLYQAAADGSNPVEGAAEITNTYEAAGSFRLHGTKTLTGHDMEAGQFRFELVDENGTVIQRVENGAPAADGKAAFAFEDLQFIADDVGTKTYIVREANLGVGGYTYSDRMYTIRLTIRDNGDGTLDVQDQWLVTYRTEDSMVTELLITPSLSFPNSYEAEGKAVIEATKRMENRKKPLAEGEFTFALLDENKQPVPDENGRPIQVKNDAGGRVVFPEFTYNLEDLTAENRVYYIREIPDASKPWIRYADQDEKVIITVSDNGKGSITAVPMYESGSAVFTNAFEPGEVTLSGRKAWEDEWTEHDNAARVVLTLWQQSSREGARAEAITGYAPVWNGDAYTFTGMPRYDEEGNTFSYYVTEAPVKGYEAPVYENADSSVTDRALNGGVIRNAAAVVKITGTKVWIDGEREHDNAKELTLTLKRVSAREGAQEETVDATPSWTDNTYTYTNLSKYDAEGYEYTYSVTETPVEGYAAPEYSDGDRALDNGTITNRITGKTELKGAKVWIDGEREHDNAAELTLTLKRVSAREGSEEETVDAIPSWTDNTYAYTDLEKYDAEGYEYTYSVTETPVEGYAAPVYSDGDRALNDGTIINRVVGTVKLSGTKVWVDGGKKHNNADDVQLALKRISSKAGAVEETLEGEEPTWQEDTYTFADLTRYDVEGYEYTYYVTETQAEGYEAPIYSDTYYALDGGKITNIVTGMTEISGKKIWMDGNKPHDNAKEITLILTRKLDREGAETETLDLTPVWEGDTYTFSNLPKYDEAGYAYLYDVNEEPVAGYEKPVKNGTNFMNKIIPPTPTVTVTPQPTVTPVPNEFYFSFKKEWRGTPQEDITFTLYNPNGTVKQHRFDKRQISATEWIYEAWISTAADYYVIEAPMDGYTTVYRNVGEHRGETSRVYNGGTIINSGVPKTGDTRNTALWTGLTGASLLGMAAVALIARKKRKNGHA